MSCSSCLFFSLFDWSICWVEKLIAISWFVRFLGESPRWEGKNIWKGTKLTWKKSNFYSKMINNAYLLSQFERFGGSCHWNSLGCWLNSFEYSDYILHRINGSHSRTLRQTYSLVLSLSSIVFTLAICFDSNLPENYWLFNEKKQNYCSQF